MWNKQWTHTCFRLYGLTRWACQTDEILRHLRQDLEADLIDEVTYEVLYQVTSDGDLPENVFPSPGLKI